MFTDSTSLYQPLPAPCRDGQQTPVGGLCGQRTAISSVTPHTGPFILTSASSVDDVTSLRCTSALARPPLAGDGPSAGTFDGSGDPRSGSPWTGPDAALSQRRLWSRDTRTTTLSPASTALSTCCDGGWCPTSLCWLPSSVPFFGGALLVMVVVVVEVTSEPVSSGDGFALPTVDGSLATTSGDEL